MYWESGYKIYFKLIQIMEHVKKIKMRGAVQKKITFLADMSVKGGGVQNPCPLRKCKFLLGREKLLKIFLIFLFKKNYVFMREKNLHFCSYMSVKAREGG